MKWLSLLFVLACSVAFARAESTNSPAASPAEPMTTELSKAVQRSATLMFQAKPNEMSLGKLKTSGIAVEMAKTRQPLKLINPFSPPANSSVEDNVARDVVTRKVTGLTIFAIHF